MTETVLLYALSTLAQTCAALAAFVGAVGVFHLQLLRDRRNEVAGGVRGRAGVLGLPDYDATLAPMNDIREALEKRCERQGKEIHPSLQALRQEFARWDEFEPKIQQSRTWLIRFEAWNLAVIGAALLGFNFITSLEGVRWVPWLFAVASVGTVIVTVSCVVIWTGDSR